MCLTTFVLAYRYLAEMPGFAWLGGWDTRPYVGIYRGLYDVGTPIDLGIVCGYNSVRSIQDVDRLYPPSCGGALEDIVSLVPIGEPRREDYCRFSSRQETPPRTYYLPDCVRLFVARAWSTRPASTSCWSATRWPRPCWATRTRCRSRWTKCCTTPAPRIGA